MQGDDDLGLRMCFADLDSLVPRVINVCVASTSAVFEPRTSSTATTSLARFVDRAAFRSYRTVNCCRSCWYYMWTFIGQRRKEKNTCDSDCLLTSLHKVVWIAHATSLELTFTCLDALSPPVINITVAYTSTVFIPSTARSAAADSTRFGERTTLWARHRISDR